MFSAAIIQMDLKSVIHMSTCRVCQEKKPVIVCVCVCVCVFIHKEPNNSLRNCSSIVQVLF